jgi:SAM-dependent methyltransferase
MPPTTSADFDQAYRLPLTPWGDFRVPEAIKTLARRGSPRRSLELGCGVGRFTRYLAREGLDATGVDFSSVAIAKAKAAGPTDHLRGSVDFRVGDVTALASSTTLTGPFDFSFDVGCFHCLDAAGQKAYAAEVRRLLRPGGIHLIWALDEGPAALRLTPAAVKRVFLDGFSLQDARPSRRRIIASHWYWLEKHGGDPIRQVD